MAEEKSPATFDPRLLAEAQDGCARAAKAFLKEVPESHNYQHALIVAAHVRQAFAEEPLAALAAADPAVPAAANMAALLHECDDRKYFPSPDAGGGCSLTQHAGLSVRYPNASRILGTSLHNMWVEPAQRRAATRIQWIALAMISLTSTHANGDSVPHDLEVAVAAAPWLLLVRHADRLEAIGNRGIYRCFLYGLERGRPLVVPDDPAPCERGEVMAIAAERYKSYVANPQGRSESLLGHCYDKLLNLAQGVGESVSPTFRQIARERHQEVFELACIPIRGVRGALGMYLEKILSQVHVCGDGPCAVCDAIGRIQTELYEDYSFDF